MDQKKDRRGVNVGYHVRGVMVGVQEDPFQVVGSQRVQLCNFPDLAATLCRLGNGCAWIGGADDLFSAAIDEDSIFRYCDRLRGFGISRRGSRSDFAGSPLREGFGF